MTEKELTNFKELTTRFEEVYEMLPPKGQYLRYANGNWVVWNGEWDLAFIDLNNPYVYAVDMPYSENLLWKYCYHNNWRANVSGHPHGNPWHYMTTDNKPLKHFDYNSRNKHPNEIAHREGMDKCCDMYTCANGILVEFDIMNKAIKEGRVRVKDTEEIIKIPDKFICIYCGEIEYKKR